MQKTLSQESVEGAGAWNKVKVVMNGSLEATAVSVDPSLLKAEGKSKLEAGLKEAITAANRKAMMIMAEKAKKMGQPPAPNG